MPHHKDFRTHRLPFSSPSSPLSENITGMFRYEHCCYKEFINFYFHHWSRTKVDWISSKQYSKNISQVYSVLLQFSGRGQTLKCLPAVLFPWLTREMQKSYLQLPGSEVQGLQDPGHFPPEVVLFVWMHLVHVLSFQDLQSRESRKLHSTFHTQQLLLHVTQSLPGSFLASKPKLRWNWDLQYLHG